MTAAAPIANVRRFSKKRQLEAHQMQNVVITAIAGFLLFGAHRERDMQTCATKVRGEAVQNVEVMLSSAACVMRADGMSQAGIGLAVRSLRSNDEQQWKISQRQSELRSALVRAAEAHPFNAAAFQSAFRRYRESLGAALSSATNSEMVLFQSLSPADQRIWARLSEGSDLNLTIGFPPRPTKGETSGH